MFLTYGCNAQQDLIHITESAPGNDCGLFCPFCGGPLTAKQGDVLAWHFAHQENTCRPGAGAYDPEMIPSYEGYFIYGLTPAQRQALEKILDRRQGTEVRHCASRSYDYSPFDARHYHHATVAALAEKNYLRVWQQPRHGYLDRPRAPLETHARITPKALAFACRLSLAEFARFMAAEFERAFKRVQDPAPDDRPGQTAMAMLQQERDRIERTRLYFLEIEPAHTDVYDIFYKVGITTRPLEERLAEIGNFLGSHLNLKEIRPLFDLPGVSYVESYFIAQNHGYRLAFDSSSEFFRFPEPIRAGTLAELEELRDAVSEGLTPQRPQPGNPERPRFQAIFDRSERLLNEWTGHYEPAALLVDVTDLSTGQRVADWQLFGLGKWLADLDPQHGDLIEFNAALDDDGQLKRPTKAIKRGAF